MKNEFQILSVGRNSEFYKALMEIWMQEVTNLESRRDSAAARGQESAWRYYAGQEKGFKSAMTKLDERLVQLEQEGGPPEDQPSAQIEQLLNEARGTQK